MDQDKFYNQEYERIYLWVANSLTQCSDGSRSSTQGDRFYSPAGKSDCTKRSAGGDGEAPTEGDRQRCP